MIYLSNWAIYRPNEYLSREDCGAIFTSSTSFYNAGGWNDEDCTNNYPYICKSRSDCFASYKYTSYF